MQNLIVLLILSLWASSARALYVSVYADDWPDSLCQPITMIAYYQIGTETGEAVGEMSRPGGWPSMINWQWCPDGVGDPIPYGSMITHLKVVLNSGVEQHLWLFPPLLQDDCGPSLPYELPYGTFDGCEAMEIDISEMSITAFASDWPDPLCQPMSMLAHWQTEIGEGWSMGATVGPLGPDSQYGWTWCTRPGMWPESIPNGAQIDRVKVFLYSGVFQEILLDDPLVYDECQALWNFPAGTFDGCAEMTAVNDPVLPQTLSLEQNYPNPINPATTIKFSLRAAGQISLKVYNLSGDLISILAEDQFGVGEHQFTFSANGLPSGIYFCRLTTANGSSQTMKMTLVK